MEVFFRKNNKMSFRMGQRVHPNKFIARHHHRQISHYFHRAYNSKLAKSCMKKTTSFSSSIGSKCTHKWGRYMIKILPDLAPKSEPHQVVTFLENEQAYFESRIFSGLELEISIDPIFTLPNQIVPSDEDLRHGDLLPPLIPDGKKTVVLDLDETLVHSSRKQPEETYNFMIKPRIYGKTEHFYVMKRPGVDEFLESISEKYEVVVFTAAVEAYASTLLDVLDPKGLISHRLYRDSCTRVDGGFVKDLSMIGRDLGNVVILDDNPLSFSLQPANGIHIKRFVCDVQDEELDKLKQGFFERYCSGVEDMRDAVREYVYGESSYELI